MPRTRQVLSTHSSAADSGCAASRPQRVFPFSIFVLRHASPPVSQLFVASVTLVAVPITPSPWHTTVSSLVLPSSASPLLPRLLPGDHFTPAFACSPFRRTNATSRRPFFVVAGRRGVRQMRVRGGGGAGWRLHGRCCDGFLKPEAHTHKPACLVTCVSLRPMLLVDADGHTHTHTQAQTRVRQGSPLPAQFDVRPRQIEVGTARPLLCAVGIGEAVPRAALFPPLSRLVRLSVLHRTL